MYHLLERDELRRETTFFEERVAEIQAAIQVRVAHYVDALNGGSSLFAATPLTREIWRTYADSLELRSRYPGINGLGIILAVAPDKIETWKTRARADGEANPEIKPFPGTSAGNTDDPYYLITFVESTPADTPPIGRNIATDPGRRRAAELARDSGEAHIHRRVRGSRDRQRRSGLILYVPLYQRRAPVATTAERRAAHVGWVYAQIFPDIFLEGVLGSMGKSLQLHFFEGPQPTRENLLYAMDDSTGQDLPAFERVTQLTLAGEPFTLGWRRGPGFPQHERSAAAWVAGSMGMATLLLAGLIVSLQSVGRRAHTIAETRTAELADSEERFRQAFEFAGIGMALVGLDGRLLRVNPALCEIVGYPEARLLQKKFQEITHPEDLAADLALLEELVEEKRRFYQLEKRYIHREGHSVWIRLSVSLVRDAQGTPVHAIAQVEDISERKRLEANLGGNRDRGMEDSQTRTDFLATMVQEIRAPANELIATSTRLRNRLTQPEHAEFVNALDNSGTAFLKILSDILDYWNLEFSRIELNESVFNLRECVHEAVAFFADTAREKQIDLQTVIAGTAPTRVIGDPKRLRQIMTGLLASAIKYTAVGEIRLSLTAEPLDAKTGRQRLKFAVRDTGSGIAGNTALYHGSGAIALAIAKRLTELMDGTLWTESEPGRGTTYHFTVSIRPNDTGARS